MKHVELARKSKSSSHWTRLAAASLLAVAALAGCGGGDDGAPGAPGAPGAGVDPTVVNNLTAQIQALTQATNPETCVTCHTGANPVAASGAMHQANYAQLYQDGVMKVANMTFVASGTTATLTFQMTKNDTPFDCTKSSDFTIGSSWVPYDTASKTFLNATPSYTFSLIGTKAWNLGTNTCSITKTGLTAEQVTQMAGNGIVVVYGVDEIVSYDSVKKFTQGKYPFAGVLKIGTVDYSSAANVSACSSCHTTPFLKHGYIYGEVTDNTNTKTEFLVCKACHMDDGTGGHQFWQILQDAKDAVAAAKANPTDTALAAKAKTLGDRAAAINGGAALTDTEKTKYAYKKKLMNDVHMSHAMEFPYPQAMNSCVTCHAGKLDTVLANSQFTPETCISCHSVDGLKAKMTAASFTHATLTSSDDILKKGTCTVCHDGANAPTIKAIHNGGFNPKIYSAAGQRYSDVIKVTMDTPTIAGNKLTIKFSAADTGATVFDMAKIKPTVLVGLYGYESKDFIVAAHGSNATDKKTNLEYVVGTVHPRFTTVSAAGGKWEVTADLTLWADKIAAGTIKRAEIAVMPYLDHPTLKTTTRAGAVVPDAVALNAPSVTFNLNTKAVETKFGEIVDVKAGCNSCHDALATTFHTADRGGNVKVCRICHEVTNPGGHLEMQSRSIDSYVHAIHSFQFFDIKNVDMTDAFTAMEYKAHVNTSYPKFGITNCESCHVAGKYDVPDQAKSMPSVLSVSSAFKAGTRNITAVVPQSVVGPANRACGSCHRSQAINAADGLGDPTALSILNSHLKQNGYMVDASAYSSSTTSTLYDLWSSLTTKLMAMF